MLTEVKKALLDNPSLIVDMLDRFGFASVSMHHNEIRCARREGGNPSAIRIRLANNPHLFLRDFVADISCDLFAYIVKEKGNEFKEVISFARQLTGLTTYSYQRSLEVFGGLFSKVHKEHDLRYTNKILDESELDIFQPIFSKRFMDDNIPCIAQKAFDIRLDPESQRIVIPIRDAEGRLIGAKGRANWKNEEDEPKYLYLLPCMCSETLFGYSKNYANMSGGDIFVCESEKAVMQAYGYGFQNFVGIAGNSLSDLQCKLLCGLFPKRIVLMLDEGLKEEIVQKNIENLKQFSRMTDIQIWRWLPYKGFPKKASPTDLGEEALKNIIQNHLQQER